jgi:hypothetical protein
VQRIPRARALRHKPRLPCARHAAARSSADGRRTTRAARHSARSAACRPRTGCLRTPTLPPSTTPSTGSALRTALRERTCKMRQRAGALSGCFAQPRRARVDGARMLCALLRAAGAWRRTCPTARWRAATPAREGGARPARAPAAAGPAASQARL